MLVSYPPYILSFPFIMIYCRITSKGTTREMILKLSKNMTKYRILIIIAALLAVFSPKTQAQEMYPFIRYEANVLRYDSTAAPMRHFFQKWQKVTSTGSGSINIVHIGGSHVQAGTFPHRVRTNILSAYPTLVGGRGLVFPYSAAAKCNNPGDYRVHCVEKVDLIRNVHKNPAEPLGLCGIAITAHDTLTRIQMLSNDHSVDYAVSHIVILGHSPQGIVPLISYENREVFPSYVDPATHRYIFNLKQTVDSFDIVLPCETGETFTLTGVMLGSRHAGITYHSIGVNGASVPDYLKCENLTSDLRLVRPDLVIFGIGINDAHGTDFDTVTFKENYLRLCDSMRAANPDCAFIFITNNDCYRKAGRRYTVNKNGELAREVFYRLADITGGAVWDQFEIMGGLTSMEKWQKAGLAQSDKVHFTHAGYQLLGDMLSEALTTEFNKPLPNTRPLAHKKAEPKTVRSSADTAPNEKPLPRGLRRKPGREKHAAIQRPNNDNNQQSNKTGVDGDRFPYISQ